MPFNPPYQPNHAVFPALNASGFTQTSPRDTRYNCISWAIGPRESRSVWWPVPPLDGKWPAGVTRNDSIASFEAAFATEGYQSCSDGTLESGYEKIALYAFNGHIKHAARQLPSGQWTSKLGKEADITHDIDALNGSNAYGYGSVVSFMRRPSTTTVANIPPTCG
jgi:hypothetical protein